MVLKRLFALARRDPPYYAAYQTQCAPLFVLDRYDEVVIAAQRVMRQLPTWTEALTMQAAAYAKMGPHR